MEKRLQDYWEPWIKQLLFVWHQTIALVLLLQTIVYLSDVSSICWHTSYDQIVNWTITISDKP